MRKLERTRTEVAIYKGFRGKKRKAVEKELLITQRSILRDELEKHDFSGGSSRWKKTKDQLLAETNKKCAYCDTPTSVVAYGDVEHYRPKSQYWWLAYCYENYLASCTLCNQKYKKAKFKVRNRKLSPPLVRSNSTNAYLEKLSGRCTPDPFEDKLGMPRADFIASHHRERPYLINPYIDDPLDFYAYEVIAGLEEVKVIARPELDDAGEYIKAAEEDFGINRLELCKLRYDTYLAYYTFKRTIASPGIPADTLKLQKQSLYRLLRPEGAYSGMLYYFERIPLKDLPSPLAD